MVFFLPLQDTNIFASKIKKEKEIKENGSNKVGIVELKPMAKGVWWVHLLDQNINVI